MLFGFISKEFFLLFSLRTKYWDLSVADYDALQHEGEEKPKKDLTKTHESIKDVCKE